jgi:hypothetical protein
VIFGCGFHEPFQEKDLDSLTEHWHIAALPWYQFLLVSPLLFTVLALFTERKYIFHWVLLGLPAWMFIAQAAIVAHHPTVRYLTALAWLMLIMLPAALQSAIRRGRQEPDSSKINGNVRQIVESSDSQALGLDRLRAIFLSEKKGESLMKKPYRIESQRAVKRLEEMPVEGNPPIQMVLPMAEQDRCAIDVFAVSDKVQDVEGCGK